MKFSQYWNPGGRSRPKSPGEIAMVPSVPCWAAMRPLRGRAFASFPAVYPRYLAGGVGRIVRCIRERRRVDDSGEGLGMSVTEVTRPSMRAQCNDGATDDLKGCLC